MQSVRSSNVLSELQFKVAKQEFLAGTEANSESHTRLEVAVASAEDDSVWTPSGRERES